MSNYTKIVDFAAKDSLVTGNAAKAGRGTEIDTEFNNIATAISTKADTSAISGKLDTSSYTAADVLAKLVTVDGPGSGLDADLLDGQSSAFFLSAANLNAGTLADARVVASNVTQHQASLALATSQITSGTFADARIAASNVTQHQASLAIATSQVTSGTFADARIASSNVTQFQSSFKGRNLTGKSGTSFTIQSGGTASGGADGDIIGIY